MKYWDRIINYFYKRTLNERLKGQSAEHSIINMSDAKTVGIVYNSTDTGNDTIIAAFAEKLRRQGKKVEILGFIDDKKIDTKAGVTIFNKKNLSWTLVPVDERVEKFAAQKFDLLLGCFTTQNLPLEFIACISKARWRVGAYTENKTECYDMMVNVSGKTDLPYLLEQITFFLNQIKYDSK